MHRHTNREEDQAEPRTPKEPATTEPIAGGQQVSQEPLSNTAQRIDEDFLHQLMTAGLGDVQNQLDVMMEGIGLADHIPKGLSTLIVF